MKSVFVTGQYRSGSTLVEKLLHNHPDMCLGYQPFPYLFYHTKQAFLDAHNLTRRYPLGQLFLETAYQVDDFTRFLTTYIIDSARIRQMLVDMKDYSGQGATDFLRYALQQPLPSGTFYDVYGNLSELLAEYLGLDNVTYAGGKEIFCEEYIPYLLGRGVKTIVVIRDPRDILTSLNYGRGTQFGGARRPTLFVIRQWRQSVSFSLALEHHPDFLYLKYEDIAHHPWQCLDRLTSFLDLSPFPRDHFADGIFDQDGNLWRGNSSFTEHQFISADSVDKFRDKLSESTIRYIETLCAPEFNVLGYHSLYGADKKILDDFTEPDKITHQSFDADYSIHPEHVEQERERMRKLTVDLDALEQIRWFIFSRSYNRLRGS